MQFDITSITGGIIRRPPIIGLAGVQGIGKTSFAAQAPSPIIIPTEDGSGEIDVKRTPLCESFEDILGWIKFLGVNDHPYKTVILDSLDHAEPLVWDKTCKEGGKQTIEAFGYGKGYIEAMYYWRMIFEGLKKLRDRKGMAVILLSHVQVKNFQDPNSDGYDRYVPKLHKEAAALAIEECDAWGFATYESKVVETTKEDRKRGVGQGKRIIHWEERPSHWAKNRYGFESPMPFPEVGAWGIVAEGIRKHRESKSTSNPAERNGSTEPETSI